MTQIYGIEYAESNYPTYTWFWTWPVALLFDVFDVQSGPASNVVAWGSGSILRRDLFTWELFVRCPCGTGYTPLARWKAIVPDITFTAASPDNRWLCTTCGRDDATLKKWIGRRVADRWEWKPENELPADLRPKPPIKPVKAKTVDEDFDARVKAAVEVEVAIRMAAMFARVKTNAGIEFTCTVCEHRGVPGPCLQPGCKGTCELTQVTATPKAPVAHPHETGDQDHG